jgi:hypothetical protein
MRTHKSYRLHLLSLLDLRSSPTVLSTLLLFALSKPVHPHQKHIIPTRALRGFFHLGQLCAFGGPGGIRTPVQNTFLFVSYSNKNIYYYNTLVIICQVFLWYFIYPTITILHHDFLKMLINVHSNPFERQIEYIRRLNLHRHNLFLS